MGEQLRSTGQEFGATTGRPRRTGWFDAVALREAVRTNGMTGLAITKLDVLNELETIRICTAYECDGKRIETFPRDAEVLGRCTPIYEDLPGWQSDLSRVHDFKEFPERAKSYLRKLEEVTGCPVVLVSVGPRRDQTIQLRNPFA